MRRRIALALVVLAVSATAACGEEAQDTQPVPARAVGLIVDLDVEGKSIRGFALRADEKLYEVLIDPEIDYGFDLAHLREHLAKRQPVEVALEQRGDLIYATEILDA